MGQRNRRMRDNMEGTRHLGHGSGWKVATEIDKKSDDSTC